MFSIDQYEQDTDTGSSQGVAAACQYSSRGLATQCSRPSSLVTCAVQRQHQAAQIVGSLAVLHQLLAALQSDLVMPVAQHWARGASVPVAVPWPSPHRARVGRGAGGR